jgi:hypothetical protein
LYQVFFDLTVVTHVSTCSTAATAAALQAHCCKLPAYRVGLGSQRLNCPACFIEHLPVLDFDDSSFAAVLVYNAELLFGFENPAMQDESKGAVKQNLQTSMVVCVVRVAASCYGHCRSRSTIGYPAESNPLQQLDVIGNFVSDLVATLKAHKQEQFKKGQKAEETALGSTATSQSENTHANA